MWSKEEFYREVVLVNRELLKDPENLKCTCPKVKCEWHGKCRECVALHRYYKDHVPNCFQQFINDKIKAIAQIGELNVVEKGKTPPEYWDYVREQDKKGNE
ncbi:MAG TPA: hypothetical protein PLD49_01765 [Thermoclostridium caenicola]|uniref:LPS biosynthesis protein n=1 Tax=Thermoclostridium caenicola TaxID=659425 RepID=A0A1M6JDE9_9FIRM|nr:hypothetical protein [Thermoclostridium caenicola]SHJ44703.1 hypothetical protein SAMN05444373_105522 [Thermoclostridium caenicola]HOK42381.1 hypothetical protein [Thermoclostridium caenicola]HOL83836.1 hypothetical protein [Thermoclostridium caenicola]